MKARLKYSELLQGFGEVSVPMPEKFAEWAVDKSKVGLRCNIRNWAIRQCQQKALGDRLIHGAPFM